MDTQLPSLTLPSGGTVEFRDFDDLTGADVHALREALAGSDNIASSNRLLLKLIELLVKTWDIPGLADPRTPEANPSAWKKLKARDLVTLERHVQPMAEFIKVFGEDDGEAGSPPPPGSE